MLFSKHSILFAIQVGSWAGNIRLKMDHPDFTSDIFILLEAARATIQVGEWDLMGNNG